MSVPMRCVSRLTAALLLGILVPVARAADKPRPAPPVKPAAEYALHEEHKNEHVTLAVEPCLEEAACGFFRLPYIDHGFIPVRVIVTNDRDEALILDDARMQLLPAEGDKIPAANDEEINRRLFSRKRAEGTRLPIIPITIHHEPVDKQITNDGNDFGFQSTTIPPHSTRAGYVFYDVRDLDEPALKGAELLVKMMHYVDGKTVRHELFAFNLPFDTWLAAQPKSAGKKRTAEDEKGKD